MRLLRLTAIMLLLSAIVVPSLAQKPKPLCGEAHHFASGQAPLKYEFQSEQGKESSATVTNNHTAALTGLVSELTMPDGTRRVFSWDAYDRNMETAAPGATMIQSFPPPRGGLPTAKLLAAVWADGSTYGDDADLQKLLASRATIAEGYERLARLMAMGLQKKWTRRQFLDALDHDQQQATAAKDLPPELHRARVLPYGALRGMIDGGITLKGKPAPPALAAKQAISYSTQQSKLMRTGSGC